MFRITEELLELEKIFRPFIVGCHLENPTPEAVEAFEKYKKWYWEQGQ